MPPHASHDSAASNPSVRPAPFAVGDHVLCKLRPHSDHPPIIAQIVALDDVYTKAASVYDSQRTASSRLPPFASSPRSNRPHHTPRNPAASSSPYPASTTLSSPANPHSHHRYSTPDPSWPEFSNSAPSSSPPKSPSRTKRHSGSHLKRSASSSCYVSPRNHLEKHPETIRDDPSENLVNVGRVYIHFLKHDHRLDRWEPVVNVTRATAPASHPDAEQDTHHRTVTRAMTRAYSEADPVQQDDVTISQPNDSKKNTASPAHTTKVRNVQNIVFGNYKIDTWYFSNIHLTENYHQTLYVCPTCLALECKLLAYAYHIRECIILRPPGRIIYDDAERDIRVYEIDAYINQLYCMRFARIAKFFIEHKVICYDICPFMFYIVTVKNEIAGYFSKERPMLKSDYNVSCILTFPQHQRKGVGSFLIALSYELSRREGKTGTPERPLSDLGRVSYMRYWTTTILKWLRANQPDEVRVSVRDISTGTNLVEDDIVTVLKEKSMYCVWKGEKSAEINHKYIDSFLSHTPLPKIPLRDRNFRSRWQSSTQHSDAPRSPSTSSPEKPSAAPTESLRNKVSEIPRSKITVRYDKSKLHSPKTGPPGTANGSHKMKTLSRRTRMYSQSQELKIIEFIKKHSPRTVLERLGSDEGISHQELKDLARSIGKDPVRVRKKLIRTSSIMTGGLKISTNRAWCLSSMYVGLKTTNEGSSESWGDEKLIESISGSPQELSANSKYLNAAEDCSLQGSDGDIEQQNDSPQENDQDVGQFSTRNDDGETEREDTSDDQASVHGGDEECQADVDNDVDYTGLDHVSPERMYYFEESEDDPYLDTDKEEEPDQQLVQAENKKKVKFNEEVVVKGGVVVIDD